MPLITFSETRVSTTLFSHSTYKPNTKYYPRVKFQQRGSPHINSLFWVHCRIWELPVLLHHYLAYCIPEWIGAGPNSLVATKEHAWRLTIIQLFTGEKCLRMSRAKWHVIRFRDYHWLSWKKHSREEQKNSCRLRIGSLLVSVLFRAINASFNASFKWNVFLENVYVL